jgi:hypothetical protein
MFSLVIAAAVLLAAAGLWLAAVCWRRRSVLGLVCAVAGIALAVTAGTGPAGSGATDELAGALAAILIGAVLLALGQAIQKMLDETPDTGA